jgi:hypothetical protein
LVDLSRDQYVHIVMINTEWQVDNRIFFDVARTSEDIFRFRFYSNHIGTDGIRANIAPIRNLNTIPYIDNSIEGHCEQFNYAD